jgi:hypothetical protein
MDQWLMRVCTQNPYHEGYSNNNRKGGVGILGGTHDIMSSSGDGEGNFLEAEIIDLSQQGDIVGLGRSEELSQKMVTKHLPAGFNKPDLDLYEYICKYVKMFLNEL